MASKNVAWVLLEQQYEEASHELRLCAQELRCNVYRFREVVLAVQQRQEAPA